MCILIFHGDLQPVDFVKVKVNRSVVSDSLWSQGQYVPGSFVHGILQARILEWVAISSSRGSSLLRDWTCVSCISYIGKWILTEPPGKPIILCSNCLFTCLSLSRLHAFSRQEAYTSCILVVCAGYDLKQYLWKKMYLKVYLGSQFRSGPFCWFRKQVADNICRRKWVLMHVSILHVLLI